MPHRTIGLPSLVRTEDWVVVWLAALCIVAAAAGLAVKPPGWRWTTGVAFAAKSPAWARAAQALAADAAAASQPTLAARAAELGSALAGRDRAAVATAAAALEAAARDAAGTVPGEAAGVLAKDVRSVAAAGLASVFSAPNLRRLALTLLVLVVVAGLGVVAMREPAGAFLAGFPALLVVTVAAHLVAGNSTVNAYGLEVVIWALLAGLLVSNTLGVPGWLRAAVRPEYFIKIGLVLLGAEVLFATVMRVGAYGMAQAIVVILAVFAVCFHVARRLGLDDEFASILGAAVSICGVSAAIAAGGAVKGDPKKVSHTISLVLLCAIPMLILQPLVAKAVGMPAAVAGAWIGGTIDTTGAVVAAGELAGREAMSVAVVTKMAQNVLIGLAAFVLAVWFSLKAGAPGEKPRAAEIWERFPKFILGFIATSIVFSFVLPAPAAKEITAVTAGLRGWWFTLGFLSIGLDTRFRELVALGRGRPAAAFLTAQAFNLVWTLLVAYLIFGGPLFPPPPLG